MLVFENFKNAAKVSRLPIPDRKRWLLRTKSGENRHFGVKNADFGGEIIVFLKNAFVKSGEKSGFLHSFSHALRSTLGVVGTLTGHLFEFHLAKTEGQTNRDAATIVF